MVIKGLKIWMFRAGLILLLFCCQKPKTECMKDGLEYFHSSSLWRYSPELDSVPVGSLITFEASAPKTFRDEASNTIVTNTSSIITGPIAAGMIYPEYKAAIDSFELNAQVGSIYRDTTYLTEGQLKGVRTLVWNGSSSDSFKIKLTIKPLAKGIYVFSISRQGYKDKDCALYRYFLKPGNSNQHLYYWEPYLGPPSISVQERAYCFKVY